MRIGVLGTSTKAFERRVPIHPAHLERLSPAVRRQLFFEQGYGEPFGCPDEQLARAVGGTRSRRELLAGMDAVILLKPSPVDLQAMPRGGVLWGWPHAVQQREITQVAIDRVLTLVAFEAMFAWEAGGCPGVHTFHRNNELAGYSAVLHALALRGIDGHFGRPRRVVVLGLGAVAQGAIRAAQALGFRDLTVCVQASEPAVAEVPGCRYQRVRREAPDAPRMVALADDGGERPLAEVLAGADIVINAIRQDPARPVLFLLEAELGLLAPGGLIIDVSCDAGMGFDFARPTSFDAPIVRVGPCDYYAVDHTPSYLWESASWEISVALLPHLPAFAAGRAAWEASETLRRAIEIDRGVILNPAILAFQRRQAAFPHAPLPEPPARGSTSSSDPSAS